MKNQIDKKRINIKQMCLSAMFTAAVFVLTAYVHIPSYTGYIHVGDGFIYLAACLLPLPYASFVGICGAFLADVLTGYAMWAPGSVIVKFLVVLLFSRKSKKIVCARNTTALLPACLVTAAGYYLYEALITLNFAAPLAAVLPNVVQSAVAGIVFVAVVIAVDKLNLKERLF